MIKYILAVFIFSVILFLYLHINYHLKCSNDLEVYTIERPSKNKLEEICDLRQPVVFEFSNERLLESCNLASLDDNYGAFDIKLRDIYNKNVVTNIDNFKFIIIYIFRYLKIRKFLEIIKTKIFKFRYR